MKRFIRFLSVLLSAILVLITIPGCSEEPVTDRLRLAIRSGTYAEVIRMCLPEFEDQTGITCEVVEFSEEELHRELLQDSLNSSGKYDIVMVDSSWVSEFMAESMLADLGSLGYRLDNDIIPGTLTTCIQEGRAYLVPYYGNVTVMLYNRTVAEELGYDVGNLESLEDIMSFCNEASDAGRGGFVARGDTPNNVLVDFLPVLRAFGGWVVDDNLRPTVNTPEFKEALEYYIQLLDTGGMLPKEEIISSIESGRAVVAVGWPGWYGNDSVNSDYCVFPGRISDESESYNSNIYGIWDLGIPSNCAHKDSAVELLEYLMDPLIQKSTVTLGGVPCRYSCLTDPKIVADNPHLEVSCSALTNGIYRPSIRKWPEFYTILGERMKQIINGEITMDNGLMLAQEELDVLMK